MGYLKEKETFMGISEEKKKRHLWGYLKKKKRDIYGDI